MEAWAGDASRVAPAANTGSSAEMAKRIGVARIDITRREDGGPKMAVQVTNYRITAWAGECHMLLALG